MTPFTLGLLAVPKAVPEARRAVLEHLGPAGPPELLLCVSEILTNVITHVGEGTPVTLRVTGTADGRTRVELTDPDPRVWPVLRHVDADAECGRGLALLDAVTLRWGVLQGPDTKTVWCELSTRTHV
ncbi:ATP-binding protein [Streptomyces sp. G-G2]|uniref:ATP-binding protein n=1 Tax=Streptomyces sp. G-G2 TaxID=3046201 RepID=UPI0024BAF186|nr:ATP-binding protein [Streptomyces sp. G-G2]MDJ0380709.1 ATP-binding protein [Streptomyces sp. G-G2]